MNLQVSERFQKRNYIYIFLVKENLFKVNSIDTNHPNSSNNYQINISLCLRETKAFVHLIVFINITTTHNHNCVVICLKTMIYMYCVVYVVLL